MRILALLAFSSLALAQAAPYTWKSCGTRLDRLATTKLSVDGSLHAGSKVTVTASGSTNLHVPLETGAWQVRIYEDGVAKSTHTEVGDLMKALKFDDPKNTTFTMTVSFTLPAKQASGKFDANIVAIDQAKADYLCLDVDYAYGATDQALEASSPMWIRHTNNPPNDPHHTHCQDVSVDTSDEHAKTWLSANEYLYTKWDAGLCDSSVFPNIESDTHPAGVNKVTLRKLGHGTDGWTPKMLYEAAAGKAVDCRSDKTSDPIKISFNNDAGSFAKIRGCQNQYACKPYQDCELSMPDQSAETITIDASFKYMVFTYKGACAGNETELYPDANMHWPATYTIKCPKAVQEVTMLADPVVDGSYFVINNVAPGGAHCTELSFTGGKDNAYYKAHGYQYQPPIWNQGNCAKKFNWFNKNTTIAKGVVSTMLGVHV